MIETEKFIGQMIGNVSFDEETNRWNFHSDSFNISVDSPWRVQDKDRIIISSGDHGQVYGHPRPIDAAANLTNGIQNQRISSFQVDEVTSDLTITFENGVRLQTFRESTGYEAWHITLTGGTEFISVGPGKVHEIR